MLNAMTRQHCQTVNTIVGIVEWENAAQDRRPWRSLMHKTLDDDDDEMFFIRISVYFVRYRVIYTTIGAARARARARVCVCVCVFAKLDQFLPVRSHFDTKRPVIFFHIATFPSPTLGPLFAFHCPLFFLRKTII